MSIKRLPSLLTAATVAVVLASGAALLGYANVVYYSGQGVIADGFGGYDLKTELCGVENGAEWQLSGWQTQDLLAIRNAGRRVAHTRLQPLQNCLLLWQSNNAPSSAERVSD